MHNNTETPHIFTARLLVIAMLTTLIVGGLLMTTHAGLEWINDSREVVAVANAK